MATIVIDVMLKPEILDAQGEAVRHALARLGIEGVTSVRQGKRFEVEVDGEPTPQRLAQLEHAAESLLSNPVIEDYVVHAETVTTPDHVVAAPSGVTS